MPPRKSNVSLVSAAEDVGEATPARTPKDKDKDKDGLGVEDLSLPRSMVGRLAKGVLPPNTQISKDALLALHKSATVFVSYLAANSNDNAQANGKKTIAPQDVMAALRDVELDGFLPRLEAELKKYNETQSDKRNTYRRRVKEEKAAAAAPTGDVSEMQADAEDSIVVNGHSHEDGSPAAKKQKREPPGDDGADDEDLPDEDDDVHDDSDDGIDATEEVEEDDDEADEPDDEDEPDAVSRDELQDEALDEPDSD